MNTQKDCTSCGIFASMYLLDMYELSDEIFRKETLKSGFKEIPNKNWRSQTICASSFHDKTSKLLNIFSELEQKMQKEKDHHFGDVTFKNQWECEAYYIPELNKTEVNKQWDDAESQWVALHPITVSGQTFGVSKHSKFDTKDLLLVDVSPLPEEIFNKNRYPQYSDRITELVIKTCTNFHRLRYQ